MKRLQGVTSTKSPGPSEANTVVPGTIDTEKAVSRKGPNFVDQELTPFEINEALGLGDILYNGDILLTPQQLDILIAEAENQGSRRAKRQAIDGPFFHLFDKSKPIYYKFDSSFCEFSNFSHLLKPALFSKCNPSRIVSRSS